MKAKLILKLVLLPEMVGAVTFPIGPVRRTRERTGLQIGQWAPQVA